MGSNKLESDKVVSKNVAVDVNVADLMKYPLVGHRSRVRRAQFESNQLYLRYLRRDLRKLIII